MWVRLLLIVACVLGFCTSLAGLSSCGSSNTYARFIASLSYLGLLIMFFLVLIAWILFDDIVSPDVGGLVIEQESNSIGDSYTTVVVTWLLCLFARVTRFVENRLWRKYNATAVRQATGAGTSLLTESGAPVTIPVASVVAQSTASDERV